MRLRHAPGRSPARSIRVPPILEVPSPVLPGRAVPIQESPSPALPIEIGREIDNFEAEMHRFLRGELSPERWRAFRLAHGVYGQRQAGVQMVRVKIPAGDLNAEQLGLMADISERFATGISHLTTRQDIQFHYLQLENVPEVLRLLAGAGLTTREACGNSVRNVTACPLSGFLEEELFEVRPYALATYAFLVRNAFCQQMARKFKIAFSGCPEDCAATGIHDIGAIARIEGSNGGTRFGFKIVVGGGLGSTPFTAGVLEEFVPIEDLLPTIKAVLLVFSEYGNRLHKMKARLKFVIHRLGIEKFRELVAARRRELTREDVEDADLTRYVPDECAGTVAAHRRGKEPPLQGTGAAGALLQIEGLQHFESHEGKIESGAGASDGDALEDYRRWRGSNIRAHRDPGRAVVTILVPLGDLEAPKVRSLAKLVRRYGDDHVRIGRDQNLVLPSVDRSALPDLHAALAEAGLAEPGIGTALDVTSCPGADTCALGITSSKGLARAIRSELLPMSRNGGRDLLQGVTIKISGCPNGCGQHHVANIGFHGVAKKIGHDAIPAYQLHLGGRADGDATRIGAGGDKIPARNVPSAVAALLRLYGEYRNDGETFADFAVRADATLIETALAPLVANGHAPAVSHIATIPVLHAAVASPVTDSADRPAEPPTAPDELAATDNAKALFFDWGKTDRFATDDIGTGECAGAGTDVAIRPFDNYEAELHQAELFLERAQWADALANLNRSQYTLARVLLEKLGKKPETDYECLCEMRAQIIDRGHASELWNEHHRSIDQAMRPKRPDPEAVRAVYDRSLALLAEAQAALPLIPARGAGGHAEIPG